MTVSTEIELLYQKVKEQNLELLDVNNILVKQNEHLSILNHVGMQLIGMADITGITNIMVSTVVNDFKVQKAAAFLLNEDNNLLNCVSESGSIKDIKSITCSLSDESAIKRSIETGRIVTYTDYNKNIDLGKNSFENWAIFPIKGKENTHGVLIAEVGNEDVCDPISILVNYISILLDKIKMQKVFENKTVCE